MKINRMTELPKLAGSAKLHFAAKDENQPKRKGEDIFLPVRDDSEFISLKNGEQFIFTSPDQARRQGEVWFGGTDEQPFLVQLNDGEESWTPMGAFKRGGEKAFYDSLKPKRVQQVEQCGIIPKRQGDIFAIPMNLDWDQLRYQLSQLIVLSPFLDENFESVRVKEFVIREGDTSVYGTRHKIRGRFIHIETRYSNGVDYFAAEGLMTAPDHEPLLLPRAHLLLQAVGLHNPQKAD